jgi:hypothetical protein
MNLGFRLTHVQRSRLDIVNGAKGGTVELLDPATTLAGPRPTASAQRSTPYPVGLEQWLKMLIFRCKLFTEIQ